MNTDLGGKIAIVTGGLHGIGRAAALALAAEGAEVAVFDLAPQESGEVRELRQQGAAQGAEMTYQTVDVTRWDEVAPAVRAAGERCDRIDVLVNNAGKGSEPTALEDLAEAEWDALLDLNLKAAYFCSRAVIRFMKRQRSGRIVNISSIAGRGKGERAHLAYASAKAGMIGFTRQLASEAGPYGINVNAVAPGAVMSGRVVQRWQERTPDERRCMLDPIPLKRIGTPEDIAGVVVFLCSPAASYITGATIDVNGGRYYG